MKAREAIHLAFDDRLTAPRYRRSRESKLAQYAEQQLIEAAKRMTPEQRLAAYIAHCEQVYAFYREGQQVRDEHRRDKDSAR